MSEASKETRHRRLSRVAEVIRTGRHSTINRGKREPIQWWTGVLTREQAEDWNRRQRVHDALGKIAINEPSLGMEIFVNLRTSDDATRRYFASRMVTSLFHASELEAEVIVSLLHDPEPDVRMPVDILVRTSPMIGTDLDIHERSHG